MAWLIQTFFAVNKTNTGGALWRQREIGYFDPDNTAQKHVEFMGSRTIYQNIYSFTARIQAKSVQSETNTWSSVKFARKLD